MSRLDRRWRSDPLWRIMPLLRPRLPRLLLAVTLGVLSLGSALALAAVSAWLITRAWQMPPILDLSVAVVAVRALGISRGVLHYCERLASHDTALRAAGSAREQIYLRLATESEGLRGLYAGRPRSSGTTPLAASEGEIVGRVGTDVDDVADALVRAVLPIAVAVVLSVIAVAGIALLAPVAALVLAVCLLIAGVLGPWLSARGAAAQEELARIHHADRDVAAMTALGHAAELRVSGRLPDLITESEAHQRLWGHALDRAARPAAWGSAAPTAATGACLIGAAVVGISLAPTLAPTSLAILMLLPLSSFEAVAALPAAAVQLTRSRIAARRVLDLVGDVAATPVEPPCQDADIGAEPRLRAVMTVGFPGSPQTQDIDIDLPSGSRMTITGPSGSGKTATLLTLAGLLPPLDGFVELDGHRLDQLGEAELRRAVGYFAEDAHVFETTVRDNLLVVRGDITDDEIRARLSQVGLGDWLNGLPDGLATVLVGGAAALSAGQRRRLLLARVLLSHAPILLLDEPTEHLDPVDAQSILADLLSPHSGLLPQDTTVVIATHAVAAGQARSFALTTVDPAEYRATAE